MVKLIKIAVLLLFFSYPVYGQDQDDFFSQERKKMVAVQIKNRGISCPKLLKAMERVERHLFVPKPLARFAYWDRPLPIGEGQTISQPYIVALMTDLLDLKGEEKVLEIGTGSGYQAAILGELVNQVYTIEIIGSLARRSAELLENLGYDNVTVKHGDGFLGWPKKGPFDAIMVTCAPERIPEPLLEQLADGGKMVIPIGEEWQMQKLKLIKKIGDEILINEVAPVRFVPMLRD